MLISCAFLVNLRLEWMLVPLHNIEVLFFPRNGMNAMLSRANNFK